MSSGTVGDSSSRRCLFNTLALIMVFLVYLSQPADETSDVKVYLLVLTYWLTGTIYFIFIYYTMSSLFLSGD